MVTAAADAAAAKAKQDTLKQARMINEWLEEAIDAAIAEAGEVHLPALVGALVARLVADTALFAAYCQAYAYQSLYTKAVQVVSKRRDVRVVHEAAAPGVPPAVPLHPRSSWLDRLDHSGERYLRLGDMYKPDLLASANEDEAQGLPHLMKAGLKRKLAAQLPDGQRVRERYKEDEIARWARILQVEWNVSIPTPAKRTPPGARKDTVVAPAARSAKEGATDE